MYSIDQLRVSTLDVLLDWMIEKGNKIERMSATPVNRRTEKLNVDELEAIINHALVIIEKLGQYDFHGLDSRITSLFDEVTSCLNEAIVCCNTAMEHLFNQRNRNRLRDFNRMVFIYLRDELVNFERFIRILRSVGAL